MRTELREGIQLMGVVHVNRTFVVSCPVPNYLAGLNCRFEGTGETTQEAWGKLFDHLRDRHINLIRTRDVDVEVQLPR